MKKTKRFVVMLLVLCLTVSCLPVGAFDFEMPETAGEMPETNLVSSALNADIDIPTEDETLGTLVWYNNFDETDAASATYSVGAYTAGVYTSTLEIADNPDAEKTGKALKITQTAAHGGYQVTFNDKLSTPGVYTLLVDIYVPEDGTASGFWTHFVADRYNGTSTDPNEWNGGAYVKGTGAWYTYQETFTLPGNNLTEESLKAYTQYILHKDSSNQVYYIDNVRIYCNAYKSAARPAAYDKTYGQLVYFENFAPDNDFENLANITLASYLSTPYSTYQSYYAVKNGDANDRAAGKLHSHGFEVSYNSDDDGFKYTNEDKTAMSGTVTVFADIYSPKDCILLSSKNTQSSGWSAWSAGVYTNWQGKKVTANQWNKIFFDSFTLQSDDSCFGAMGNDYSTSDSMYARAIGVYLQPDNAFWLTSDESGADRTFTVIPGETYTFPAEFNGKAVSKWAVGANLYAAGETVEKSAIAAKTAYPFEYPETYDETYGQLVFYSGFHLSDAPFVNEIEELSPIKGLAVMQNTYNGIAVVGGRTAFSAKGGAFGNGGYAGIGITSSDGQLWKYEDGTVVTGRVVAFTDYYYDIAESEDFNKKDSLFVRYTPSDDSIYALSEAKKSEWLTTRTPESYMAAGDGGAYERFNRKTGLSSFTIGRSGNADKLHFDNIKVYVKPNNALWLVDAEGGNRTFEVVSAETYTFPAAFNGVNVRTWKNGDTTYKAGEAVALAAVAGKTWTVSATTDVAFADAVSVRTSGTPGIRFKATLDLAIRADENFAEIGFMATRDTHYTNAFDASADSFILANANAANAKLCTVVRKSGSDLNRYLTEGDGELNFNALVVGVPENTAYLTENLHLRAFIVCGGVTYYSAVKTDSVYGAVKRVSADPNYENDPYIRRIIELCETTNG